MTQGHRSHLDGFLLCESVNLSSVLTLFFGPNLPGQTWAKKFQDLCLNLIATIATDNTMVVTYLRSEGSKLGPLCVLLWRIMTWCSRKQAQARHIHTLTMSRPGIHCVEMQCLVSIEFIRHLYLLVYHIPVISVGI